MALSASDRRLVRLFTACVLGRWDQVQAIRAAATPPEPDRRWREAVLQVHVFAGFPRLVEAYAVLEAAGGLGAHDPDEHRDLAGPRARGRELFDRIYASDAPTVRSMLERHHADFAAWIEEHAYGRVLSRPGLDGVVRELLAVAALAALGQERQLASHARGSLRLGAHASDVEATLGAIEDLVEPGRIEKARRVVERFAPGSRS